MRAWVASARRRKTNGLPQVQIPPMGQDKTADHSIPLNAPPQDVWLLKTWSGRTGTQALARSRRDGAAQASCGGLRIGKACSEWLFGALLELPDTEATRRALRVMPRSKANKFSPAPMLFFGPNSAPNSGRIPPLESRRVSGVRIRPSPPASPYLSVFSARIAK